MPILADVINIASVTNSKTVTLSALSVAVLLSALDAANRLYDWQGESEKLTSEEVDAIDEFLSIARYELMSSLVGQVIVWGGESAPANSLLCDGFTYTREDYPELYNALADVFIVDTDTFVVPNLSDRFVYGVSATNSMGSTGGEESHTLSESEIPGHVHSIPYTTSVLAVVPGEVPLLAEVPIITENTGSTGGGGSHNNIPPYTSLAFYIIAR
jgi:microcystin-dependent protein